MMSLMTLEAGNDSQRVSVKFQSTSKSIRVGVCFVTKYSNMLRKGFLFVIVIHCFVASAYAAKTTEKTSVSSTTQKTPEIKERFFGLDNILGAFFHGPNHNHNPGLGFSGNQQTGGYPIQQNPQQGNWQNTQASQQYPNQGQDFGQQANFDQYPSQNQGNFNSGNGLGNGQNQQGNWQNPQMQQQYPNQGQNFNQQYPQNQGNLNPGNSQWSGPNQNSQGQQDDWRNVRTPQQFPSQQDFSQQYNSDQYPSQSQDNFGPGPNQNFNTGTIDDIPSQNGIQQTRYPNMQNQNTGQNGFQNQNMPGNSGNYNPAAILGKPVQVSPTASDRIVFQDEWV